MREGGREGGRVGGREGGNAYVCACIPLQTAQCHYIYHTYTYVLKTPRTATTYETNLTSYATRLATSQRRHIRYLAVLLLRRQNLWFAWRGSHATTPRRRLNVSPLYMTYIDGPVGMQIKLLRRCDVLARD